MSSKKKHKSKSKRTGSSSRQPVNNYQQGTYYPPQQRNPYGQQQQQPYGYGQQQQQQPYRQQSPYSQQQPYGQQQPYNQQMYRSHQQQSNYGQAPPAQNDRNFLQGVFSRVDQNRNGEIDCVELQNALSNGTWNAFNIETVRLMMSMFDNDDSGTINFDEFTGLWKYITDWQQMFTRFDADQSGYIDKEELKQCLSSFGYRLTDNFYNYMMTKFDRTHEARLYFDNYVLLCVMLQTLTTAFKDKDTERKGHIRLSYEEFLIMAGSYMATVAANTNQR